MQRLHTSLKLCAGAGRARNLYQLSLCLALGLAGGCMRADSKSHSASAVGPRAKRNIIAQGQILPAGGFVQLATAPGDVVAEMLVAAGDTVVEGQTLAIMRSKALRAAQRATLSQQRTEALREQEQATHLAEQKLLAAELRRKQLTAQQIGLARQAELLELAKMQADAARQILKQLEKIADDRMTSEFVGRLEVERQRLAASQAELDFQQQRMQLAQATEDLEYAIRAADADVQAAHSMLDSLNASQAIKVIDLQLAALDVEDQAASIVAPQAGVILAVNASKGEASVQKPLIEMANLAQLVCEVEVNEMDAGVVVPGQSVVVRSRAFEQPLTGTVDKKFQLVGRPQLRPLDPLARVDYRSVTAIVQLDPESIARAKDWLQLQVEVEIDATPNRSASDR